MIDSIVFRKLYKQANSKIHPVIPGNPYEFKTLTYNGEGSENIPKCLQTYNINFTFEISNLGSKTINIICRLDIP